MKNSSFNKTVAVALVTAGLLIGCENGNEKEVDGPPSAVVKMLSTPSEGARLELESTDSQAFSWNKAVVGSEGSVTYEVVFDKENGDFSSPVYSTSSGAQGANTSITLSNNILDEIATDAGAGKGEDVTLKWGVVAKIGTVETMSEENRKLVLVRAADPIVPPDPKLREGERLYIAGDGSEAGQEFKQTDTEVYEIYTKIEAGKPYHLSAELDGERRTFSLIRDGNNFEPTTGASPTGATVTETGTYRITVEFDGFTVKLEKIDRVDQRFTWTMTDTEFSYKGKGVWELKSYNVKLPVTDWGLDERYKIVFTVDGTEEHWGQLGPELFGNRPAMDREGYRDMTSRGADRWDEWQFKFPAELVDMDIKDRYITDIVVSMKAEGNYTHYFENYRSRAEFVVKYTNPIFTDYSLPDPDVIRGDDGYFYLYATEHSRSDNNMKNVPVMRSSDLINWTRVGAAFTDEGHPQITTGSAGIWAPSINRIGNKYVMYYSQPGDNYKHAIGVAVADTPTGPFVSPAADGQDLKLIDSNEQGVDISIDAYLYQEDGRNYLFWGSFRSISVIELTADGYAIKEGEVRKELAGGQYEAAVVEKRDGYYYLILSTGDYSKGGSYRLVVGRSQSITGPYVDKGGEDMMLVRHALILRGNGTYFSSPGHCSRIITDDAGEDWILYHGYVDEFNYRVLLLDKLTWGADGWPVVNDQNPSRYGYTAPVFN